MSCQTFEGTLAPGAPASLMCSAGVCNMPLSQNDITIADTETPAAPRYLVTLEDLTRNQSGALRMDAGEVFFSAPSAPSFVMPQLPPRVRLAPSECRWIRGTSTSCATRPSCGTSTRSTAAASLGSRDPPRRRWRRLASLLYIWPVAPAFGVVMSPPKAGGDLRPGRALIPLHRHTCAGAIGGDGRHRVPANHHAVYPVHRGGSQQLSIKLLPTVTHPKCHLCVRRIAPRLPIVSSLASPFAAP